MKNAGHVNDTEQDTFSWNLTIGAERRPDFDVDSVQEAYYRLRQAQLIHHGTDSFSITSKKYQQSEFVAALNLERCPGGAAHSGVNTGAGSQLTINLRNTKTVTSVHVVLHYDQVVNVSAAGVEVLD
ncbi:MAG: hypothetical protein GY700_04180 [Propionibacteriaceae bacterium]|nr:hypothetical protein [Propionibacteriaceae bacterium]